jgi:hypothetical protein
MGKLKSMKIGQEKRVFEVKTRACLSKEDPIMGQQPAEAENFKMT